ncbi:hypothetical protein A2415_02695 [candidate division WWE3 bacterium RIFOXYC1_FULL_39_7]|uniref:tRNA/rRNA methyltransferase SpoU type domain-containing protein n=2 Tax=Katanobacteria TaxID=422282 RepID=A0A1F4X4N0_UNCKA|nr:MAG: hypothetical protein A2415_02695 [candidate division WWE3 bacterium RIFOXYC1_FULL_39_7]OGC76638.1 MAG: hypothetical protein A2619_04285 [candidate division WWE3 bacterium RIFOXYD1_FULL_39_9]
MLKTYNKKSDISYSIGVAPTIELLEHRPEEVMKVLINPKGSQNTGLEKIIKLCAELNTPVEENQKLIEKLSQSENTYALASFRKYSTELNRTGNHVVLVNPSDMGNIGTICRTMLAFDFTELAIIKPAVDFFDPKVVRASMGAIFSLNFEYFDSFEDYQKKFGHNIYTFIGDGKTQLDKVTFNKPYSLVFGNEGEGLTKDYKELGESVRIPQSSKVDSFNLSIAVGISLYEAWRN